MSFDKSLIINLSAEDDEKMAKEIELFKSLSNLGSSYVKIVFAVTEILNPDLKYVLRIPQTILLLIFLKLYIVIFAMINTLLGWEIFASIISKIMKRIT